MGEICDCCGRPQWSNEGVQRAGECARLVGGAWHVHYSEDCYRLGYEREKAARASLEARLAVAENERNAYRSQNTDDANAIAALEQRVAELEGVAASRADAALLRGRAAHDAQERVRAIEQRAANADALAVRYIEERAALEQQVVELREALEDVLAELSRPQISAVSRALTEKALDRARAALANHQPEKKK